MLGYRRPPDDFARAYVQNAGAVLEDERRLICEEFAP
jgi:hypothetical protein